MLDPRMFSLVARRRVLATSPSLSRRTSSAAATPAISRPVPGAANAADDVFPEAYFLSYLPDEDTYSAPTNDDREDTVTYDVHLKSIPMPILSLFNNTWDLCRNKTYSYVQRQRADALAGNQVRAMPFDSDDINADGYSAAGLAYLNLHLGEGTDDGYFPSGLHEFVHICADETEPIPPALLEDMDALRLWMNENIVDIEIESFPGGCRWINSCESDGGYLLLDSCHSKTMMESRLWLFRDLVEVSSSGKLTLVKNRHTSSTYLPEYTD